MLECDYAAISDAVPAACDAGIGITCFARRAGFSAHTFAIECVLAAGCSDDDGGAGPGASAGACPKAVRDRQEVRSRIERRPPWIDRGRRRQGESSICRQQLRAHARARSQVGLRRRLTVRARGVFVRIVRFDRIRWCIVRRGEGRGKRTRRNIFWSGRGAVEPTAVSKSGPGFIS